MKIYSREDGKLVLDGEGEEINMDGLLYHQVPFAEDLVIINCIIKVDEE